MLSIISRLPRFIRERIVPNMLIGEIKNDPSKVQLVRLSHVYFEHTDLNEFVKFAEDFGLVEAKRDKDTIYFRGYGKDPYVYVASKSEDGRPRFGGPAFVAANREEFDKAAKIPGATFKKLDGAPGGGEMVTIARTGDTFIHVVFGQEEREVATQAPPSATHESLGAFNTPFEKPRQGQFQRFHQGPALIHKLGHFGYICKDFDSELEFYTSNFNFVPSDILYHPQFSNIDVMIFMHLDLGPAYVDHHIMFIQRAPPEVKKTYVHHSSFEVADFDTQLIGHEWLGKKGWTSVWGVGRHILGSQVFDYWKDPSGFKIEHYADGDVVNEGTAMRRDVAGALSIWGPEPPKDFGEDGTRLGYTESG